jgi:tetratricopeptide (TPR) repeat protein
MSDVACPSFVGETLDDLFNYGNMLLDQGKLDEAISAYSDVVAREPGFVQAHYGISLLRSYKKDDPHVQMLEDRVSKISGLPAPLHEKFWFTLGKMREDTGNYTGAFEAYTNGNNITRTKVNWSDFSEDLLLKRTIKGFTKEWMSKRSRPISNEERVPIFIMGMPRSGTTLIEQILDTVPSIHGAGELALVSKTIIDQLPEKSFAKYFPQSVLDFTPETFRLIGENYINEAWEVAPNTKYLVDKMPANSFYLGIMYLMFPNAKFIHATRDPMDSCFSCYTRLFKDRNVPFSYDQGELGRFYVRYRKHMKHWESILPPGTVHEVSYENIVIDTEKEARRLLEYIGVPWDKKCLEFYNNDRIVKTSSFSQVRQPIYKTSLARWVNFENELDVLYETVKDYR